MNRFKKPEDYPVAVKVIVTSKTDNRDNTAIFELQTIYVDFAVFSPSCEGHKGGIKGQVYFLVITTTGSAMPIVL